MSSGKEWRKRAATTWKPKHNARVCLDRDMGRIRKENKACRKWATSNMHHASCLWKIRIFVLEPSELVAKEATEDQTEGGTNSCAEFTADIHTGNLGDRTDIHGLVEVGRGVWTIGMN